MTIAVDLGHKATKQTNKDRVWSGETVIYIFNNGLVAKSDLNNRFTCLMKNSVDPNLKKPQGWHRLEKYLNSEGFLEKSMKIKPDLKSTGKSIRSLEKSFKFFYFL